MERIALFQNWELGNKTPVETAEENVTAELRKVLSQYNWVEVGPVGNESRAFELQIGDTNARLSYFSLSEAQLLERMSPSWFAIKMAFGEVRNVWENRTPMGEHGCVSANFEYNEDTRANRPGYAIPGNNIIGRKWSISAVAPKGRTVVPLKKKMTVYIKSEDIIQDLLRLRSECEKFKTANGDLTNGAWDTAKKGWV